MGSYPYAESIFPLGGQRGHSVDVEFVSKAGPVQVDGQIAAPRETLRLASMPGSPTLPFRLAVSDYPEVIAPVKGPLVVPVVVNGRIAQACASGPHAAPRHARRVISI